MIIKTNSTNSKGCSGCEHIQNSKQWCYMFDTAPEVLPCTQHNKFKEQRKLMGKLILGNPNILNAMVQQELNK